MIRKVAFYLMFSVHMVAAFLLQVKYSARAPSLLKGVTIEVASSHGQEKTEVVEYPPIQR